MPISLLAVPADVYLHWYEAQCYAVPSTEVILASPPVQDPVVDPEIAMREEIFDRARRREAEVRITRAIEREDDVRAARECATNQLLKAEHNIRSVRQDLGESLVALEKAQEHTRLMRLATDPHWAHTHSVSLASRLMLSDKEIADNLVEAQAKEFLAGEKVRTLSRQGVSAIDTLKQARLDFQKSKDLS